MEKLGNLGKLPASWRVADRDETLELFDEKGNLLSSLIYRVDKGALGKPFIELVSVASGENQGRGYCSILYNGLESLAKSKKISQISLLVKPENHRAIQIYHHFGFSCSRYVSYVGRKEKRIVLEKKLSAWLFFI